LVSPQDLGVDFFLPEDLERLAWASSLMQEESHEGLIAAIHRGITSSTRYCRDRTGAMQPI
jgi:hypothetical protein